MIVLGAQSGLAAGLYNHPFKALRPRHVPLAEVYLKKKTTNPQPDVEQFKLF